MTALAEQTLQAVSSEIGVTLGAARAALEAYADTMVDPAPLLVTATALHEVFGALRVIEIAGAALLCEEMEHTTRYLAAAPTDVRNQPEALDAVMRAIVQLPGYLERVLAGARDVPLVLLPLLNDLRAVRGQALLSEGTLLLLNLTSDREPEAQQLGKSDGSLPVAQWARQLRPKFQLALLGVLRGERVPQHLDVMAQVAERIERAARRQSIFQFWWVVGAVIEAMQQGGMDGVASVKRLLGQVDRELRRLHDQGEDRYAESPPIDLLNNLLYFVARTKAAGHRISAVRESFRLDDLLPVSSEVEDQRANLSAPSIKLMQTVGAAIRDDIGRVKDALDIFVRSAGQHGTVLSDQLELLHKIGDTLGVLGLANLREVIKAQYDELQQVLQAASPPDSEILVRIAAALIQVEDSLETQLVALVQNPANLQEPQSTADDTPQDDGYRKVHDAVLRECMVNLAHVKDAFTLATQGQHPAKPQAIGDLIHGVVAGLSMLDRERAAAVVRSIGEHILDVVSDGARAPESRFDRLADAIVSLEYYLETLQSGRSEPSYMLDNAEACLRVLATVTPARPRGTHPEPSSSQARVDAGAHSDVGTAEDTAETAEVKDTGIFVAPIPVAPQSSESATILTALAEEVDPDLVQIFTEEAREELPKIIANLQLWVQNPLDDHALQTMRRSFHTLKGSGRMVGARLVGDFSWAVENLLNRVINGTRNRSPLLIETINESIEVLPQLIDQLETRELPVSNVSVLIAKLHTLAEGNDSVDEDRPGSYEESEASGFREPNVNNHAQGDSTWMVATSVVTTLPAAPASESLSLVETSAPVIGELSGPGNLSPEPKADDHAPSMDADLTLEEIYRAEVTTHVAALRAWAAAREGRRSPHPISESLYRACHTLAGASRMAGVEAGTVLAEPLNDWIRERYELHSGLPEEACPLMIEVALAFEQIANARHSGGAELQSVIARLVALIERNAVPAESTPSTTASPDLTATGSFSIVEFDAEIASIFSDEAAELLEAMAIYANRLVEKPRDAEVTTALMRYLHTLKGGARMAGLSAMGELAHDLESLLTDADRVPALELTSLVQAGVDELEQMRDQVRRGIPATCSGDLIARIRANLVRPPAPPVLRMLAEEQPELSGQVEEILPNSGAVPVVSEIAQGILPQTVILPGAVSSGEIAPPLMRDAADRVAVPPESVDLKGEDDPSPSSGTREDRVESARVDPALLDLLLNGAGEISIQRARLEQQLSGVDSNLAELSRVVSRLRDQLRKLEIETEAQILHRHEESPSRNEFDPLELDRYSTLQQYSRALAESATDVASIQGIIEQQVRDAQAILTLQARVVTDVQNGLMRTRMVSFQRHIPRLNRIVRQAALETGKSAELLVTGATGELDRQVLERMLAPFEHLLRNAVIHGIEAPIQRAIAGKEPTGRIELALRREGSEVVIVIQDDGAGLNLAAIREKAVTLGLLQPRHSISDADTMQLILEPGFSTADVVTASAGRGVGMDVVSNEVKRLGGALQIDSTAGQGTRFTVRLPFTLAVSQALLLRSGSELYALPLPTVESVVRLPKALVMQHLAEENSTWAYGGQNYTFQHLGRFIGGRPSELPAQDVPIPVVLIRAGDRSTAIVADELVGSREIVIKSVGPVVSSIRGVAGATILGDGRIVVILDLGALVRGDWRSRVYAVPEHSSSDKRTLALVVDDSITVRRVTQRLLERNGMRVLTARDGVDALAALQDHIPDVILLDIEMPRMDGYELASRIRADQRLAAIPIVMITSRVGEKHRARAIELGIDDYLGKPYQESQLLDAIEPLVTQGRRTP